MGRENKKEAVAALHKERILKAAEALFSEKGFEETTLEDISRASEYSRRTIYAYYESKDDILHHIIENGLLSLKNGIENAIAQNSAFLPRYRAICAAMYTYQRECPHSLGAVEQAGAAELEAAGPSDTVGRILSLGKEINALLAGFIEKGKEEGAVRQDVIPMMSVYVLWAGMSSLLALVRTKGAWICRQFSVSENEFLTYGFRQIINSILTNRI